jgi:hypothetical protein
VGRCGYQEPTVIPLLNVQISGGKVRGVTFLVEESAVPLVDRGVHGVRWITH